MSYNEDFYKLFNEIADLLALLNENGFRIRAYQNAARTLKEAPPITKKNANKNEFMRLPRIGEDISKKMMEYIRTGKIKHLEDLRKKIPKPVRDLLKIPHLGPGRVRALYINLGIKSKKDLLNAARSGQMESLPRFGKKLVEQVVSAIKKGQEKKKRHKRADIEAIVKKITKILKTTNGVTKVKVAGSFRRGLKTVGDVDFLVQGEKSAKKALMAIKKSFKNPTILASGERKISFVIFPQNLQIDIRFVAKESWGAALLYFTGSKDYNVSMRKIAIEKGYLLNEYGLFNNGEYIAGATEAEVFKKLSLKSVEPAKRK